MQLVTTVVMDDTSEQGDLLKAVPVWPKWRRVEGFVAKAAWFASYQTRVGTFIMEIADVEGAPHRLVMVCDTGDPATGWVEVERVHPVGTLEEFVDAQDASVPHAIDNCVRAGLPRVADFQRKKEVNHG